jgi:predicted ATPase
MRLVGDLLAVVAPRPSVLVLEDSHWLDSASWRLVEWVSANHSSMLTVVCVRSEEVPEELRSLQRRAEARMSPSGIDLDDPARFCRVLPLEELNDAEIRELSTRILGGVAPEHELANRISSLADGNPLFAEEIVLSLKTEGLIAIRDGLWRSLRPLDELRYFEGVERVIRERIDRVPSKVLDVLKASAVIGRSALQVGAFREVEAFLAICFSHESKQLPLTEKQRLGQCVGGSSWPKPIIAAAIFTPRVLRSAEHSL